MSRLTKDSDQFVFSGPVYVALNSTVTPPREMTAQQAKHKAILKELLRAERYIKLLKEIRGGQRKKD